LFESAICLYGKLFAKIQKVVRHAALRRRGLHCFTLVARADPI
jgi:hypothetical protein